MKSPFILLSLLAAFTAGCTAGCTVGPDYHAPTAAATSPAHWGEKLAGGEEAASAGLADWWSAFHDPELDSLIGRAVRSNLDLRIAQARVREARARYGIAASTLAPSADLSGSDARQQASHHQPVLGSVPTPPTTSFENQVYEAGVDASWEIDVFGGRRREVEAARAEIGASEDGARATTMVLLGDVARNYVTVRGYQRRLAIAAENIRAQQEGLAITQDRFAHGLATDLDVEEASGLLAETLAEVPALEARLQASIHRLGVLLGQPPGALLAELSAPAPIPAAPDVVPVGLPSDLLLRRPDVGQAERRLAAATANIGVAKSDLFPKFYLTGAAGYQSVRATDWFSSGSSFWSIGPSVQWKIFDAGRVRANIRVQDARQEEALAAYERTVLAAFEEVENGLASYAKEQIRCRSLQQAEAAGRKSLALANRLYAGGLTDFLRVLEAERSFYQAEDEAAQSDEAISADLVSLYESLGGGWRLPDGPAGHPLAHDVGSHRLPQASPLVAVQAGDQGVDDHGAQGFGFLVDAGD
jgi:multidrug efflux system outer membrane protein